MSSSKYGPFRRRLLLPIAITLASLSLGSAVCLLARKSRQSTPSRATERCELFEFSVVARVGQAKAENKRLSLRGKFRLAIPPAGETRRVALELFELAAVNQAAELKEPKRFDFIQDSEGRVTSFLAPLAMKAEDRNLLGTLALSWGFALRVGEQRYEIKERDLIGDYRAAYAWESSSELRMRKVEYYPLTGLAGAASGPGAPTVRIGESAREIALSPARELESSKVKELLEIDLGAQFGQIELETVSELYRRGREECAPGASSLERNEFVAFEVASSFQSPEQLVERSDRMLVQGVPFEAALSMTAKGGLSKEDRRKYVGILAAWLRLEPKRVGDVVSTIARDGAEATDLVSALGEAASEPGALALVRVFNQEDLDETLRKKAGETLILARSTWSSVLAALLDSTDRWQPSLRETGWLALGRLADYLTARDSELVERTLVSVEQRLAAATDPKYRHELIDCLGNAGNARSLPVLAALVRSGKGRDRAVATMALRRIAAVEADELLAQLLATAPDPVVRVAATNAASMRDPKRWFPLYERAIRTDKVASVRQAALQNLSGWHSHRGERAALLVWVAGHDPEPKLKQLAVQQLAMVHRSAVPVPTPMGTIER